MEEDIWKDFHKIEFDAGHRCDRCGARAMMAAFKNEFRLLFCGHHGRKMNAGLSKNGFIIIEEGSKA